MVGPQPPQRSDVAILLVLYDAYFALDMSQSRPIAKNLANFGANLTNKFGKERNVFLS